MFIRTVAAAIGQGWWAYEIDTKVLSSFLSETKNIDAYASIFMCVKGREWHWKGTDAWKSGHVEISINVLVTNIQQDNQL